LVRIRDAEYEEAVGNPSPIHRRPFLRALVLSLALHAALLIWLFRHAPPPPLPPRPATRVTLRTLPSPPPRPAPRPSPPGPAPPPDGERARAPAREAEPPGISAAPPAATRGPPGTPPADAPLQLFPPGAISRGAGPPPSPGTGATSGRDVPESPEAEARRVKGRVDGWNLDAFAEERVAVGVDDYFKTYRRALQANLGPPPPGGGPRHGDLTAGQRWINAWLEALEASSPSREPPRAAERMPAQDVQDVTGRMEEFVGSRLGPMAVQPSFATQRLLQRAGSGVPIAVLHIVQRADGSIASQELVASSGDKAFDAWVVEHAALALAAVPPPPARQGAGLRPDGTRTEWAFFRNGDGCGVVLLRVY